MSMKLTVSGGPVVLPEITELHNDLLGAAARAYCHRDNGSKQVDPLLLEAVVYEVEEYLRGIRGSVEYKDFQKALRCLYLATEECVADDVKRLSDDLLKKIIPE